MRPPRFRLRTLLILVAVAAVGLWAERMWRRSASMRQKAALWAKIEAEDREMADRLQSRWVDSLAWVVDNIEALREEAERAGRLRAKYERAAMRPWLPVEPDPPDTIEPD